jgi:hypothetical protein
MGRCHGDCGGRTLILLERRLDRRRVRLLRTGTRAPDPGGDDSGRRAGSPGLLGCSRWRDARALQLRIGRRLGGRRHGWRQAGPCIRLGDRRHLAPERGGSGGRDLLSGRRCRCRRRALRRRCCGGRRALRRGRCCRWCVLGGRRCCRRDLLGRRRRCCRRRVLRQCCSPRALGWGSVRRWGAALLAGRGLAGTLLTGRPALLVLRLGGLRQAPAIIQCGRRASARGCRDDGQHRCGNQKRCSCHAVSSSPGWIGPRPLLIRRICAKRRNAPQQCQQHDKTTAIGRAICAMVKRAQDEPTHAKLPGRMSGVWRGRRKEEKRPRRRSDLLLRPAARPAVS